MPDGDVTPGQPLRIAARDWNGVRGMLGDWRRKLGNRKPADPQRNLVVPSCIVRVWNDGEDTYPASGVVGLADHAVDPANAPLESAAAPVTLAGLPVDGGPFGIVLAPILPDSVGYAAVAGMAVAKVNVTDVAHRFAVPVAGDSSKLESAETGPVQLVSQFDAVYENAVALVLLDQGATADGGDPEFVQPDEDDFTKYIELLTGVCPALDLRAPTFVRTGGAGTAIIDITTLNPVTMTDETIEGVPCLLFGLALNGTYQPIKILPNQPLLEEVCRPIPDECCGDGERHPFGSACCDPGNLIGDLYCVPSGFGSGFWSQLPPVLWAMHWSNEFNYATPNFTGGWATSWATVDVQSGDVKTDFRVIVYCDDGGGTLVELQYRPWVDAAGSGAGKDHPGASIGSVLAWGSSLTSDQQCTKAACDPLNVFTANQTATANYYWDSTTDAVTFTIYQPVP